MDVVDLLEVVDVEHHERQRHPVAQAVRELLAERVEEVLLVEDAREAVARGRLVDGALVLLLELVLNAELHDGVGADLNLVAVLQGGDVHLDAVEVRAVRRAEIDELEVTVRGLRDLAVPARDAVIVDLQRELG